MSRSPKLLDQWKTNLNGQYALYWAFSNVYSSAWWFALFFPDLIQHKKKALAIRRIFSLVDMITKSKFSNRLNVFKIGLFW